MKFDIILKILMIIGLIAMILENNNLKLIIYLSAFSVISASLYYLYNAPDVALAEIAIGSAIVPLLYIISIGKQSEFLIITHIVEDEDSDLIVESGVFELILEFAEHYNLKVNITSKEEGKLIGVFREKNIDIIIDKSADGKKVILKGKKSNLLMNRLESLAKGMPLIEVVKESEGETID